jgi:acetolactate synthase-1/2/3 large subunit
VGGGAAGLNDGFCCNPNIEYISFHHEQGAGHAAVGAARSTGKLAVANITTGCGGTNALTSCLNAWQESVPVLFLSGNTNLKNIASHINEQKGLSLRKYGAQEHDIVGTVKNITKYAVLVESIGDLRHELEKAIHIATSGRRGPVWVDVPADVQNGILPDSSKGFLLNRDEPQNVPIYEIEESLSGILFESERPIAIAGAGISASGSQEIFREFVERYKIPFVTNFLTRDVVEYEHSQNLGMWGIKGNRVANFAIQNADCLLALGSSMNATHVGYDTKSFSPHSKKIVVDIDTSELNKGTFKIDAPLECDVNDFLRVALADKREKSQDLSHWNEKCTHWKNKWPVYDSEIHRCDKGGVNLYEIVESINRNSSIGDLILVDSGQLCYICSSNIKPKKGQRYMVQAAQGDMGYAIPALIGIHFARPDYNIITCIGDGSFHTNMQELAGIRQHNIPAKIIVVNNGGYMTIKQTQSKFFEGHLVGIDRETGVYMSNIKKIAEAFEIDHIKITNNKELDDCMKKVLAYDKPIIIEIMGKDSVDVLPAQAIKPDGTQAGLHDMAPFLSEAELSEEMIVKI